MSQGNLFVIYIYKTILKPVVMYDSEGLMGTDLIGNMKVFEK